MSTFSKSYEVSNENNILSFFKGLIVSLMISFGLVILFAFCLKWFSISEKYIFAGTIAIKAISVFLGALIAIKGKSRGLLKGLLFGLIYITLAFLLFSFLSGSFVFDNQTILDFVSASIVGGIVGIIKVNK